MKVRLLNFPYAYSFPTTPSHFDRRLLIFADAFSFSTTPTHFADAHSFTPMPTLSADDPPSFCSVRSLGYLPYPTPRCRVIRLIVNTGARSTYSTVALNSKLYAVFKTLSVCISRVRRSGIQIGFDVKWIPETSSWEDNAHWQHIKM